jgi:hypothetical protein
MISSFWCRWMPQCAAPFGKGHLSLICSFRLGLTRIHRIASHDLVGCLVAHVIQFSTRLIAMPSRQRRSSRALHSLELNLV